MQVFLFAHKRRMNIKNRMKGVLKGIEAAFNIHRMDEVNPLYFSLFLIYNMGIAHECVLASCFGGNYGPS